MAKLLKVMPQISVHTFKLIPFWNKLKISRRIFYSSLIVLMATVFLFIFNFILIKNFSDMVGQIAEIKERQLFFEGFNKDMINIQTHINYINKVGQNGQPLPPDMESQILLIKNVLEPKVEQALPIVQQKVPEKEAELKNNFNQLFKAVDGWAADKSSSKLGYLNGMFYNAISVTDYLITKMITVTSKNIEQLNQKKVFWLVLGVIFNIAAIFIFIILLFPLLKEVKTAFKPLLGASETTFQGANQSLGYAAKINEAIKQLSEVLNQIAININGVSDNAQESSVLSSNIIDSVKTTTDLVGDLARKASATMDSLTSYQQNLEGKISQINTMTVNAKNALDMVINNADIAEKLAGELLVLDRNVQEISKILIMVSDITEQTNLLSLNASIEAARAGEYGRGFNVVAERIMELSNQTKNLTSQIKKTIAGIQGVSDTVTNSLKNVITSVRDSTREALNVTQELSKLEKVFESLYHANEEIISAANLQLGSTKQIHVQSNQIVAAVQNISLQTESVSASMEELSASSEEINAQIQFISTMVDDTHQVIEKQVGLAALAREAAERI